MVVVCLCVKLPYLFLLDCARSLLGPVNPRINGPVSYWPHGLLKTKRGHTLRKLIFKKLYKFKIKSNKASHCIVIIVFTDGVCCMMNSS